MWKRSEVEKLTGLTRHMIQDLCNPNTSRDGLGFWKPAVSKPGYSRFDEGDLCMFYLVGVLKRAGFSLMEIEPVAFDLLDDGDGFEQAMRAKADALLERRAALDSTLSAIKCLARVAEARPIDRLFAVMEVSLSRSVERAVCLARHECATDERTFERVRVGLHIAASWLTSMLGNKQISLPHMQRDDAGLAESGPCGVIDMIVELIEDEVAPTAVAAHDALWRIAGLMGSRMSSCAGDALLIEWAHVPTSDLRNEAGVQLAMWALTHFFAETENGVPVELVFGKGSFSFLSQASRSCVHEQNCLMGTIE